MAYIVKGHQENEIIEGDIQGPLIWAQNLEGAPEEINLVLTFNPVTGNFALETERSDV